MRSSFNISNISYGKPFNISWQSVVLDFVPPSTFPAYRSPRPQLVQPSSPYCNTRHTKGKILTVLILIVTILIPTPGPAIFSGENTDYMDGGGLFVPLKSASWPPSPLRKFAQLKNFSPEHQRSEVSTVYLH